MTYKKIDNDINILKKQTIDIMNRLEIPIRKNHIKDDSLILTVYKSSLITANYGQEAIFPYIKSKKSIDTLNRIYKKPFIALSSVLYDIMIYKKDTSKIVIVKALGSVVHELTHYFQLTFVDEKNYIHGNINNQVQHITQPIEFEAYAVDAYYYLFFIDKKSLKQILKRNNDKIKLYKELINKQWQIQYPNDKLEL